jgi:hypothetical protein
MRRKNPFFRLASARGFWVGLSIASLAGQDLAAQNVVPNPTFAGAGGVSIGVTLLSPGVPDQWRAFAVGGGAAELEVVPVGADEIFQGSPETNAVLFRVTGFGADQGFDDDNGKFPIIPGLDYHGEFYVRSANADLSEQRFHFGFPLFNAAGVYQGIEPGGLANQTATSEWQHFTGPVFQPRPPVGLGHLSWRCVGDGGEDAILIALPSVTSEGTLAYPTNLACNRSKLDVQLSWQNHDDYESLVVLRDGVELAALDPAASDYLDADVPDGVHTYQVLASLGGIEDGPTCEASVFRLAAGAKVSVDLNEIDVEDGLVNNVRGEGGDGENAFVLCGSEDGLREARSNYGSEDPTPDFADPIFYFNVTDPALKAQSGFKLEATVYDDPEKAGTGLFLQYTNADSTGPADIPNTFFPLQSPQVNTLGGTGEWVVLDWDLPNAGFRSFQQGAADFRLGVTGSGRVCLDRVDLLYFPAPTGLSCRRQGDGVELTWENNDAYQAIKVSRDGVELAALPGDATSYLDDAAAEGLNVYRVTAVDAGIEGGPSCSFVLFRVPAGTSVAVDLGELDSEDGLANVVRGDGGDGENSFALCGPEDELREGRSNLGTADPTPDFPDPLFYFTVTEPAMKAQLVFLLEVTVYDDPALAGAGLYLQYTNVDSTGPGDIPNTFFPLQNPPVNTLGGTGEWVVLTWDITNAGFRSFQQGAADFRLGVTNSASVCLDEVKLTFPGTAGPPAAPTGLTAAAGDGQVLLDWADNAEPDLQGYNVYRSTVDGGPHGKIADLVPQSAFTDTGLVNGTTYYYVVRAVNPGGEGPASLQVSATPASAGVVFRRGDVDASGTGDITDAIVFLGSLFLGDPRPPCFDAADVDDNGRLEITDAIVLLGHLFLGQPAPPAPGLEACGADTTPAPPGADFGCAYPAGRCP